MSSLTPTRVVLVDDDQLVRAGLRLLLHGRDGIEVVAEARDGLEAEEVVASVGCDVVLMDVRMPRRGGVAATEAIASRQDPPAVVILTTFDEDLLVLDALAAGAVGFLLKDTSPDELVRAVVDAGTGRQTFAPVVLDRLVALAMTRRETPVDDATERRLGALTDRERDVAEAVAEGSSNAEIAAELFLSLATVKTHLGRVFDKLGVTNRVQVAILVREARR